MIKCCWIFLLSFLCIFSTQAQEKFINTNTPVRKSCLSNDGSLVAFGTYDEVFVLDASSMKILHLWKFDPLKKGIITEFFFHPTQNTILTVRYSRFGGQYFSSAVETYPEDSLFIYNLEKGTHITLPGNTFVAYEHNNDHSIVAYNLYTSSGNFSRPGGFVFYPEQKEIASSGVVSGITISDDNKFVAISYYSDSLSKDGSLYTIELRSLPAFEKIAEKKYIIEDPTAMKFSADGKYLYFETVVEQKRKHFILNTITLNDLTKGENISLPPYILENELVHKKDYDIEGVDFFSGKQNFRIWANLTGMFSLEGALRLNKNEIFVYGQLQIGSDIFTQKGRIEKMALSDLSAYAKKEDEFQETKVYDPGQLFVQDNLLFRNVTGSSQVKIFASPSNKYLFIQHADILQVWLIHDRKKLHEIQFQNKIIVFSSSDDNQLLVLEQHNVKKSDEYKMHAFDLSSGIMRTRVMTDLKYTDFSMNYYCHCYTHPQLKNTWTCLGNQYAYLLNTDSLSVRKAYNEPVNHSFFENTPFSSSGESYLYLSNPSFEGEKRRISHVSTSSFITHSKEFKHQEAFHVLNDSLIGYSQNNSFVGYNFFNEKETVITKLKGRKIKFVLTQANALLLIIQNTEKTFDSLTVEVFHLNSLKLKTSYKIPEAMAVALVPGGLCFSDYGQLFTRFDNGHTVPWSNKSSSGKRYNMDYEGDKYLLYKNELLIDLSTLKTTLAAPRWSVPKLLRGKFINHLIYIEDYTYSAYAGEKLWFRFHIAPVNNYQQPVWTSEKLEYPKGYNISADAFSVSGNGNFVFAYLKDTWSSDDRPSWLIDLTTKKTITLPAHSIYSASFSEDEKFLYIINDDGKRYAYSTATGKKTSGDDTNYRTYPELNGKIILSSMKGISINEPDEDTVKQLKFYYSTESIESNAYIPQKNYYAGGSVNGNLYFWHPDTLSPVRKIKCGSEEIYRIEKEKNLLYTFWGNNLSIIDLDQMKLTLTMKIRSDVFENSVIWYTPEGNFSASKKDINELHFTKELQTAPVLSYEIYMNRPDLILEKTGKGDEQTIRSYREAYLRRLKKNGLYENFKITELSRSSAKILNKESINPVTSSEWIEMNIEGKSFSSVKLKTLHLYVNGVPVFGTGGKKITPAENYLGVEKIKLQTDINKIQVSFTDAEGIESSPDQYEVELKRENPGKVYYLGIGVSRYKSSPYNLEYASKDVNDIQKLIREKYPDAEIHLLTDSMVTREKIKALKKDILMKTDVNDLVILSLSGHGVIVNKNNFYYATYDMDFEHPENSGISYNEIEEIFDSIPARKKLILMDACHSGEVDAEEVEEMTSANTHQQGVKFRHSGPALTSKNKQIGTTNLLISELFSDLRTGTGANIISSSGALEYSMESGEWKNGLFSYCFMNGLKYKEADLNKDGTIMMSELQVYLRKTVSLLSNGTQQPTTRMENLSQDFKIW